MRFLVFLFSLSLFSMSLVAHAQGDALSFPTNLTVPEGNTLLRQFIGDGVQIYHCEESAETPGTYTWVFAEPQADLYNEAYERMGIHYAGPTWEANDGSMVVGEVAERADSPDGSIPWLLLRAISAQGNGVFSHVSFVQRLDTVGGIAPAAETCTEQQVGKYSRVPYTAHYLFYTADPVDLTPVNIPDNLKVPEGNHLAFELAAEGVQIYRCEESSKTPGTFVWTFVAPSADLMNEAGQRVAIHYRGPIWEGQDGSFAVGEVAERADSPDGSIPWLLLKTASTHGNGNFGNITFIQRLDTVGGTAPAADTCTAESSQHIKRIPYSALYVFYAAE